MNKLVLISSYCDDEEKINTLRNNLKKIKSLGLDTAVISAVALPEDIIKLSDYVFFTKENIIFTWPDRVMVYWKKFIDLNIKIVDSKSDYGFNTLNHLKRLGEMFLCYDYDHYFFIIYDLIIDDNVEKSFIENNETLFYKYHRTTISSTEYPVGMQLISLTKDDLEKIIPAIKPEIYLKNSSYVAEIYAEEEIVKRFNFKVSDISVKDSIFLPTDVGTILNNSTIDGLTFFISVIDGNPDENPEYKNVEILFYDIDEKKISLRINGIIYEKIVEHGSIIDLGYKKDDIYDAVIYYNGKQQDIKNIISLSITSEIITL